MLSLKMRRGMKLSLLTSLWPKITPGVWGHAAVKVYSLKYALGVSSFQPLPVMELQA